ncbi:tetratricopeptide repeat-containing sensor histidine kinase [Mucilaginibacter auburnensis]|uniref:tetratricopeptide repeat-containing sensor histidine kinase n=1 Tax=Mucilaginibacter auburnensis TaxID=1457233 RepID=UPI0014742B8C|nr:tetratricopeptide repeat-containing sensor histidine kinase [Mucilaginibacter auburnensis]
MVASIFLYSSCKHEKNETGKYTDAFIPIFNQTTRFFDADQTEKGLKYLDSAFAEVSSPSYSDRFRYYSLHYVHYQRVLRTYQKALMYADSMMQMANKMAGKHDYVANLAEANYAKGDSYFDLKQYNESFQCYYQGYLIGKSYLNNEALSDYTYRMGMIMYKKGRYKAAANYFKESYRQKNSIKTEDDFVAFYRKQELLDNIALSYKNSGDLDSAIAYFDKAKDFVSTNGYKYPEKKSFVTMALGVVYGNEAEIFIAQKQYDKAIDLLKKSITINLQKGFDNIDAQYAQLKLGKIYAEQHRISDLKAVLDDLRIQLDSLKNGNAEAEWNRLMGDYYIAENDLQKALSYLQTYNRLKDSLAKQSSLLRESDVMEQLANYEKAHQIQLLNENNKIQRIYLVVSVLFGVMAIAIIFLVYRYWSRSKNDVKLMNELNKQINEQNSNLEQALEEVKLRSQEKDRILRAVAHDLRNPIGGIASLTTIMAEEAYTDEQKEMINLVKETSYNSLELINDILEAANVKSINLIPEPVEINSLVNNSVELLRFKAAEKGQLILFEPLNTPQELLISREKIWRVISNLISNAIKFSPTGAMIDVKVEKAADQVIVSVKDNGIGIPEKMQDQVFNMFTSAQRPGTAGEKSFGLGLSICQQIMEKSGGAIWFKSRKDGTTFYISLPLIDGAGLDPAQKVSIPFPR